MQKIMILPVCLGILLVGIVMVPGVFGAIHEVEAILGSSAHECDSAWGAGWSCYQDETKDLGGSSKTTIAIADSVKFVNNDNAAHTFTSGYPVCAFGTASCPDAQFVPNGIWDSGLVMPGSSFTVVFNIDDPVHNVVPNNSSPPMPLNLNGVPIYPYFCEVHPWMYSKITVEHPEGFFDQPEGFFDQPDSEDKTNVLSEAAAAEDTEPVQQASGGCGQGTVLVDGVCQLAPQESNDGCGAGTVMVNGVCQLAKTGSPFNILSGSTIEPLYIVIGAVTVGAAIVGIVFAVRRGSGTPKPAREELEEYESRYVARKPAEKKETSSSCNSCGTRLKPTAKFCGKCGSKQ